MPQISVIIPAYRPTSFTALDASMAANNCANVEWIVVDDGSGPEYYSVFDGLPDGVRLIRLSDNRRQGAARNAGLAQASGRWVKFLDSDDRLDEGHLSALLKAGQSGSSEAIPFAPTLHIFPNGRTSVNDSWRDLEDDSMAQIARQLYRPFLHHCGALFPRDLLNFIGGYDESLVTDEDGDLLIRVLMQRKHFVAIPSVQYHYIHHRAGNRVSSDKGVSKLAARLHVCNKVQASFADEGLEMPDAVRHGLAVRMDKIAVTFWSEDRATAQAALDRAQRLYPGYRPDGRWPMQFIRAVGGPSAAIAAARLWRRARNRPLGGAQG